MRNLSKVLALVLALSMIVGVVAFAKAYPDVDSDANYAEAVNVISDLGLAVGDENGNFNADKTLTRAEGTTFVLRLLGLEEAAKAAAGSATDFSDVPADHWAAGYVSVAAANGIVSGMGDGTFAPNADLTYAQIVRMLVSALGYEPLVSELGEWPNNYMSAASQIKLTTGIAGRANDAVTRGTTARLIYAALTIPKMEKSGIGVNATWAAGDQMILDDLGFFKLKGKVTEVDLAANKAIINIEKQCLAYVGSSNNATGKYLETDDKDKWTIDAPASGNITSKELNGFGTALKDSINVPVIIYVADDDDFTIASFVEQSNVVDSLAIDSADYKEKNAQKVTYYTNADQTKTSTFKLDETVVTYLNGSLVGNVNYETFINDYLAEGDYAIELKDTDGDGYFDMALVTDYKYMVVKTVKVTKDGVYTFTSETLGIAAKQAKLVVDTEDDDVVVTVIKDGEEIDIADIEEGDILNIKGTTWSGNAGNDLTEGTIYVTNEIVEGTVKSQDTEENTVTLDDGSEYDYLDGVNTKYLEPAAEGSYYLNINNKIIYVDNSAVKSNYKYGFATLVTLDVRGGEVNGGDVRVLTTDGTWSTIDLNSTVNGTKLSNVAKPTVDKSVDPFGIGKELYVAAADSRSVDLIVNEIIAYKTNSTGAIRNIAAGRTAIANMTEDATAYKEDGKYTEGDFAGYYVTDSTKIFSVKSEIPVKTDLDENKISLITKNALKEDDTYTAALYNINDDDEVGVMFGDIQAAVDYEGKMFIVSKVSKTSVDDDDYTLLTGYQNGEEVKYMVSDDTDVTELYQIDLTGNKIAYKKDNHDNYVAVNPAKGDIFFITAGSDNVVSTGVRLNNVENPTDITAAVSKAVTEGDDEGGFIVGYVLGVKNNKVYVGKNADTTFDVDAADDNDFYFTTSDKTFVTVYDGSKSSKNQLDEGTVSDIDDNTALVFARLNENNKAMEVVVYID